MSTDRRSAVAGAVLLLHRGSVDSAEALIALARGQGGLITRQQALRLGMTPPQIATALRRGSWRKHAAGVYQPGAGRRGDPLEELVLTVAAMQLRAGDDSRTPSVRHRPVAYGRTAARLHGLPLLGRAPATPLLVHARPGRSGRDAAVVLPDEQIVLVDGVRVTSLARTALDVARTSSLLGGVITTDGALARGVPAEELQQVWEACRRSPGSRRARQALDRARPGAESALEALGRLRLVDQGIPEPELQVQVHDREGFVGRVDQLWRAQGVVGEADGLGKYTAPEVLRREKVREDRIRDAGLEVVRYGWDEAWHRPERVAERVRDAFRRARRVR